MITFPTSPIIFFDGECSFCSFWVNLVLRWEKSPQLRFCASQSPRAREYLTEADIQLTTHTVLLLENGKLYRRSSAVLRILRRLRWFWIFGYLGYVIPESLRNVFYDFVARHRQQLSPDQCAINRDPTRFLD